MNRRALDTVAGAPGRITNPPAAPLAAARPAGPLGDKLDKAGAAAFVAIMIVLPLVLDNSYLLGVLSVALIYALWAVSWDFMSGLTGRENFGHALFIGAGGYTAGFMNTVWFIDGWWSIPAAMVVASIFAVVVGLPTLRLKGPYFALAMLSASVIMERLMLIYWEYTGGEEGINGIEPLFDSQLTFYYFALAVLLVVTVALVMLARSNWGLVLRAIRGDEATCQAAGLNVTWY